MKRLIIAVTGASGSGKSTFAKALEKKADVDVLEINDVVTKYHAFSGKDKFGTRIVKLNQLSSLTKKELAKRKSKNVVLVGHLAPELSIKYDIAVVTRCKPALLAKRLEKRAYPKEKLRDNIVSEAVDYCGVAIIAKCNEVYEIESESDKSAVMKYIAALSKGKKVKKPKQKQINNLNGLLELIKDGNKYGL